MSALIRSGCWTATTVSKCRFNNNRAAGHDVAVIIDDENGVGHGFSTVRIRTVVFGFSCGSSRKYMDLLGATEGTRVAA